MLVFSLKYKDRLYYQSLETGKTISFGCGQKDTVRVMDMTENQISVSDNAGQIRIKAFGTLHDNASIGTLIRLDAATGCSIYISRPTGTATQKVKLPYDGVLKVGRVDGNDVVVGLPFVSGKHFLLRISNGNVRVEDLKSTNGLYHNGQRIQAASLRSGDVLNILTVRIRIAGGNLEFENVGSFLKVRPIAPSAPPSSAPRSSAPGKYLHYRRSPRIQEQLPNQCIILDNPPRPGQEYVPRDGRVMSAVSGAAMIGANLVMGMASPQLAAARSLFLVPQTMNFIYNLFNGGKIERERQQQLEQYIRQRETMYKQYIADQQARINAVAGEQRRIIAQENPDALKCLNILSRLDRTLWQRLPRDRDFLDVRLGMGYEPLCVDIKSRAEVQGFRMEHDELEQLCSIIAEENQIVDNVPARLPLRQLGSIGVVGRRGDAIHLVRNMLVSLTTLHSPQDLRIVGIFDESERSIWSSLRWLPHVWDDNQQFRFLAFDRDRAHNVCELLTDTFKKRREQNRDGTQAPTPHYVLLLGSKTLVEREPLMQWLTQEDPGLGLTTLFMYDDLYNLPYDCRFIVDLNTSQNGGMPCAYDKSLYNKKFTFAPDTSVSSKQFSEFTRNMAAVRLENFKTEHSLPGSVTFLEGYGVKTVQQLDVLSRWRHSQCYDSLAVPIGTLANGRPFLLDIHPDGHGPHGLVAGTTGSGKSELLQSWILSMALNFHPHDVNFVVIDYKGGGLANLLEPLPHMIGKITNIGTNITRSLISLKSEVTRREALLAEHGVKSVGQYQRLYKSGRADLPMPRLVIISDEFAELKKENSEFLQELTSIARVGRSLGIHLILATQKPFGVVDDQTDSNSRFRICLKVNDVRDSKDILKRPDAAQLTQPGRAYIRVGEDEMFELFQSYWSGAPYQGNRPAAAGFTNQVRIVDIDGQRRQTVQEKKARRADEEDELTAIVRYIRDSAKSAGIRKLPGLWLPELPQWLPLEELSSSCPELSQGWFGTHDTFRIPVGMYDIPSAQRQGVQYLDFSANGHHSIYGTGGSGKTTLLKTILLSLGRCYSPRDVNIYAIDFGGRSLNTFGSMPHMGSVIMDYEEDKLKSLVNLLQEEIDSRKSKFQSCGAGSFASYRRMASEALPYIVLVIDNITSLIEGREYMENFLSALTAQGTTYGVYLVCTANSPNGIRFHIQQNIPGGIAFEMTDQGHYAAVVGRLSPDTQLPTVPGRALIRDNQPVYFQAATYLSSKNEEQSLQTLRKTFDTMCANWGRSGGTRASSTQSGGARVSGTQSGGARPSGIKTTSRTVTVEDLAKHYALRTRLPLGLDYATREPVFMDLSEKCALVLCHTTGNGDAALRSIAQLLATRPDNHLYIIDSPRKGLEQLRRYAQGYALYTDDASVSRIIDVLCEEYAQRESDQDTNPYRTLSRYPQIWVLICDVCEYALQVSEGNRDSLRTLCVIGGPMGFGIIASGEASQLQRYQSSEPLTRALLDCGQGLSLSGSAGAHPYFATDPDENDKTTEPAPQDGLLFCDGKATRILRML